MSANKTALDRSISALDECNEDDPIRYYNPEYARAELASLRAAASDNAEARTLAGVVDGVPLSEWLAEELSLARDARATVDQQAERIAALEQAVSEALELFDAICAQGGNLPDDRLTSKTCANDAVYRGIMYTYSRSLAKRWLAAHPAQDAHSTEAA